MARAAKNEQGQAPKYLRMSVLKQTGKGVEEMAMRRGKWLWLEVGLLPQESDDATEPLGHERCRRQTCGSQRRRGLHRQPNCQGPSQADCEGGGKEETTRIRGSWWWSAVRLEIRWGMERTDNSDFSRSFRGLLFCPEISR